MDRIAVAIASGGLDVQPFQRRFLAGAFRPGITTAALTMARGGGKTELIGRLAALAVVPGSPLYRPGCEAIVVAGSMRQAALTYKAAKRALPDTVKVSDPNQQSRNQHRRTRRHGRHGLSVERQAVARVGRSAASSHCR